MFKSWGKLDFATSLWKCKFVCTDLRLGRCNVWLTIEHMTFMQKVPRSITKLCSDVFNVLYILLLNRLDWELLVINEDNPELDEPMISFNVKQFQTPDNVLRPCRIAFKLLWSLHVWDCKNESSPQTPAGHNNRLLFPWYVMGLSLGKWLLQQQMYLPWNRL